MVRDPFAPPPAFVSYVEARLSILIREARRYVPDERYADQVARDLLASVAVKWPWYGRLPGGGTAEQTADRFLRKAFPDSVKDYADPQRTSVITVDLRPDATEESASETAFARVPEEGERVRRSPLSGQLSAGEEAEFLWQRSARTVRRRTLIAAGVSVAAAAVVLARPRREGDPGSVETPPSPSPGITAVPRGVDLLPSLAEQGRLPVRKTPLPEEILFEKAVVGLPRGRRARAVLSPGEESSVVLLDDGKLYAVPDLRVRADNPGALSPDGRFLAYRERRHMLFDMTTGQRRELPTIESVSAPIWLDPTRLLFSVSGGCQVVGVDGKPVGGILHNVDLSDVLVPQGQPAPMTGDPILRTTELLSIGRPLTAPARVRRYAQNEGQPVDTSLTGALTSWIGLWRGVGFALATSTDPADRGLVVRRCQTAGLLPVQLGEPESAVAVARATTGAVARVLVDTTTTGADRVEPVGWLNRSTVLVSTNSIDATLILAWDLNNGALQLVSVANRGVRCALRDLSI
ncbi:MAG: hypothetical protein HOV79_17240 [Hamadaea sp.]|nr:hypothetical protein [Hamadaea sp.]